MKTLLCCSNNRYALCALKILHKYGFIVEDILFCGKPHLKDFNDYCKDNSINVITDVCQNTLEARKYDLLISFTYQKRLPVSIINTAEIAINFHPAPLPQYKGRATGMHAIMNGEKEWGVTCHFLDEDLDTGDIIEQRFFSIYESGIYTGKELSHYSWKVGLELLEDVIKQLITEKRLIGKPQEKTGKYYSMKDLINAKKIDLSEDEKIIERKVNGLWYPPHEGAYIQIGEQRFYLMTEYIMKNYVDNEEL